MLIYYITNYATKKDYSQYQKVKAAAITKKAFKDQNKPNSGLLSYISTLDKFLLKIFNRLLDNCKVDRPLIIKLLLDLLDYFTSSAFVKLINIFILKIKFLMLIFRQNFNTINDIVYVNSGKVQSYFIFKHYSHKCLYFL